MLVSMPQMEHAAISQYKVDRTGWPSGPWDSEPDRLDFIHAGFSCFLLRNHVGAWCGYVGVPETHSAFGKDEVEVEVHGGLTYANLCRGAICHVPAPGMPEKVWWLGFDTAHCTDYVPGMSRFGEMPDGDTYRNIDYTRNQTEKLAEQLRAL
jgi:hypothetical protein